MGNFNIKKVLAYYLLEKSNKKRPRKIKRKNDKICGLKSHNIHFDENVF